MAGINLEIMKELECLRDCNSACCHDLEFRYLSGEQLLNLLDHDAVFEPIEELALRGPCPMLRGESCLIYSDNVLRPDQCFRVTPGGSKCLEYRAREGYRDE